MRVARFKFFCDFQQSEIVGFFMCATLKVNCASYVPSFQHQRSSSASFRRDMTQIYDSAESRECAFVSSARSSGRKSEIKISRDTFDITTVELLAVLLWNDFIPQLTMRLICLKLETQRFLLFCVSAIPPKRNSLTQPSQKTVSPRAQLSVDLIRLLRFFSCHLIVWWNYCKELAWHAGDRRLSRGARIDCIFIGN